MRTIIGIMLLILIQSSTVGWAQEAFSGKPGFKGATTNTGQLIEYPQFGSPEIIGRLLEFQPGQETGWHKHTVPTYTHVVEGTLTIEFEDGTEKVYNTGTGLLDAMDAWHTGRNLGTMPLKVVVVVLGVENNKNLIRREQ